MTGTPEDPAAGPELLEAELYMDGKGGMRPKAENASEDAEEDTDER